MSLIVEDMIDNLSLPTPARMAMWAMNHKMRPALGEDLWRETNARLRWNFQNNKAEIVLTYRGEHWHIQLDQSNWTCWLWEPSFAIGLELGLSRRVEQVIILGDDMQSQQVVLESFRRYRDEYTRRQKPRRT